MPRLIANHRTGRKAHYIDSADKLLCGREINRRHWYYVSAAEVRTENDWIRSTYSERRKLFKLCYFCERRNEE